MDFKNQLKKEKLMEKIREKGRPATVSELQELSHIGEEGKWFDKLSDKDKLNYRQLPDISDQDSLKIMEEILIELKLVILTCCNWYRLARGND